METCGLNEAVIFRGEAEEIGLRGRIKIRRGYRLQAVG